MLKKNSASGISSARAANAGYDNIYID